MLEDLVTKSIEISNLQKETFLSLSKYRSDYSNLLALENQLYDLNKEQRILSASFVFIKSLADVFVFTRGEQFFKFHKLLSKNENEIARVSDKIKIQKAIVSNSNDDYQQQWKKTAVEEKKFKKLKKLFWKENGILDD